MADKKEVYELDLGGNILDALAALEQQWTDTEAAAGDAGRTFADFVRETSNLNDALGNLDATQAAQQYASLDRLYRAGIITLGEMSEAYSDLRNRVDDVTDRFKIQGEAGEDLANTLEKITDPAERLRVAQRLWNQQTLAGFSALGKLNNRLVAADAEIQRASGGLLNLEAVTKGAAIAWGSLAAAAAAAGAVLVKVGKDAVAEAAEENVYLRTELERLEAQWEQTQQRLGEAIIGGPQGGDAIGFFGQLDSALTDLDRLLADNDAALGAIIPTILYVGEVLVKIFSVTAPAALTPLLVLIDSIKFAVTGLGAVLGDMGVVVAGVGQQLGLFDDETVKAFESFQRESADAFDTVGLESWTAKAWEAGGALRGLVGDLGDAAQASQRLVSSFEKLYILQNTDLLADAAGAFEKAAAEFQRQGIGRAEAEILALKSLSSAQRKLLEDTERGEDARSAAIAKTSKTQGAAADEQARLDAERRVMYDAETLRLERLAEAAERSYARITIAQGQREERELIKADELERLQALTRGAEAFATKLTGVRAKGLLPSEGEIAELQREYTELGLQISLALQAGAGSVEGIGTLEAMQARFEQIKALLTEIKAIDPWDRVLAQSLDAGRQSLANLTLGIGEMVGAMAAGSAGSAEFSDFLKQQFIGLAKTIAPILLQTGFSMIAAGTGNPVGMIAGAIALSAIVGAVAGIGGGRGSNATRYDAGAAQAQFRQAPTETQQTTTVVAVFGTDQLEPTITRVVQGAQRRGLLP